MTKTKLSLPAGYRLTDIAWSNPPPEPDMDADPALEGQGDDDIEYLEEPDGTAVAFSIEDAFIEAAARLEPGRPRSYRTRAGRKTIVRLATNPMDNANALDPLEGAHRDDYRAAARVRSRLSEVFYLDGPNTEHRIDLLAAQMLDLAPLMAPAIEAIRSSAQLSLRRGATWFQFKPLLVISDPGLGKTTAVSQLAKLTGLPMIYIDGSLQKTITAITSQDSVFRSSRPSAIMTELATSQVANSIVVLDEVDKLTDTSTNGSQVPTQSLLSLTQAHSAAAYHDTHLQLPVNLSFLNWVLLANDASRIAGPLLDRCTVVRLPRLTAADLKTVAIREVARRGLEPELLPILVRATRRGEIKSLRKLHKLLDAAQLARNRPLLN